MKIDEYINKLIEVINEALKYNHFVRDKTLQEKKVQELESYILAIHQNKFEAEQKGAPEFFLNRFFHFQCVMNAVKSSLNMWIKLKDGKNYEAWCSLQDAIDYIAYSQKVEEQMSGINDLQKFLMDCEKTLFPVFPLYNSSGLLFKGGNCSICGKPLEKCEHIEEYLYNGKICKRINITDVAVNHIAMVEKPDDKRCIIQEFQSENGEMYDYMTLLPTEGKPHDSEHKTFSGVVYNTHSLDIF